LRPTNGFVAQFVGDANVIAGHIEKLAANGGMGVVQSPIGRLSCWLPKSMGVNEKVTVMFRPESPVLHAERRHDAPNIFPGSVKRVVFVGSRLHCDIEIGSVLIRGEMPSWFEISAGQAIDVELPPGRLQVSPG
jgi:ABC-type Fe3+/spermidine/putrescine transport system ATPase subunit